jgi:hypothetical protein
MEWLVIPLVTFMGMWGGQLQKWVRRYGIPALAILIDNLSKEDDEDEGVNWRAFFLLLLAGVLSMGYGVDSKLGKLFKSKDWIVRIAYGLLLGAVTSLAGYYYGLIILPIAWSIRLPFSFKIGKFDWLWEDFVRYSALGFCIWRAIL